MRAHIWRCWSPVSSGAKKTALLLRCAACLWTFYNWLLLANAWLENIYGHCDAGNAMRRKIVQCVVGQSSRGVTSSSSFLLSIAWYRVPRHVRESFSFNGMFGLSNRGALRINDARAENARPQCEKCLYCFSIKSKDRAIIESPEKFGHIILRCGVRMRYSIAEFE